LRDTTRKSTALNSIESDTLQRLEKLAVDGIGYVRYASGHRRTNENRRLDWALIEAPTTFSRNKPPSDQLDVFSLERGKIIYKVGPNDFITTFGTVQEGQWVVKAGRTTTRSGFINKESREVRWDNHVTSVECDVIGNAADFAMGGDLGSWVVNEKQELVGILIGSDTNASDWGSGLVTPIEEIMKDIALKTGGQISLP